MDVSFVITSYNYADYIESAIESCINQYESKLKTETIIVDDGSTDFTKEILNRYTDTQLLVLKSKNIGVEKSANLGISHASGKYIVRVDADDSLYLNYARLLSPHIDGDFDFIYGNYSVINKTGSVTKNVHLPKFSVDEIVARGDFLATGTAVKKEIFVELEMYSQKSKNCGIENYELILRGIKNSKKFKHVPKKLFKYRIHGNNMSSQRRLQISKYAKKLFSELALGSYKIGKFHPYLGET